MLGSLQFVKDNWAKIALTWNGRDNHLIYPMDTETIEYFEKCSIPNGNLWSCFFSTGFILDIYGLYDRNEVINKPKIITDILEFSHQFQPGYIYHFGISNHEFIVIYDHSGCLYYIDYYMETGRGCRQIGPAEKISRAFRLEIMPKEKILKYLESYLLEDFKYHTKFHQGDEIYENEYITGYYHAKSIVNPNFNYYQLEFTKHKITCDPTIESIINVVEESVTEDNILSGCLSTPEEIKVWKRNYSFILSSLHKSVQC